MAVGCSFAHVHVGGAVKEKLRTQLFSVSRGGLRQTGNGDVGAGRPSTLSQAERRSTEATRSAKVPAGDAAAGGAMLDVEGDGDLEAAFARLAVGVPDDISFGRRRRGR